MNFVLAGKRKLLGLPWDWVYLCFGEEGGGCCGDKGYYFSSNKAEAMQFGNLTQADAYLKAAKQWVSKPKGFWDSIVTFRDKLDITRMAA